MKSIRYLAIGAAALLASSLVAVAAGLFPGFPIVGGAAYCNTYSTGTSGQFCTNNTPAGPANLAGTAMIPADTGLSQGQTPQTVLIPAGLTGATSVANAPLTGATIAVPKNTAKLMLKPAGTIATLTVTLPAAADIADGQTFGIWTSATVTALTVTPGSGTIVTPTITTVTAAAPIKLIYNQAALAWQLY